MCWDCSGAVGRITATSRFLRLYLGAALVLWTWLCRIEALLRLADFPVEMVSPL